MFTLYMVVCIYHCLGIQCVWSRRPCIQCVWSQCIYHCLDIQCVWSRRPCGYLPTIGVCVSACVEVFVAVYSTQFSVVASTFGGGLLLARSGYYMQHLGFGLCFVGWGMSTTQLDCDPVSLVASTLGGGLLLVCNGYYMQHLGCVLVLCWWGMSTTQLNCDIHVVTFTQLV